MYRCRYCVVLLVLSPQPRRTALRVSGYVSSRLFVARSGAARVNNAGARLYLLGVLIGKMPLLSLFSNNRNGVVAFAAFVALVWRDGVKTADGGRTLRLSYLRPLCGVNR